MKLPDQRQASPCYDEPEGTAVKKVIFIGNSIVNGFPASRGKSFPGLIRAAVKSGGAGFLADVINKGNNGETTEDILARFEYDVLRHEPAAVFIMTGTNDFIYREADPEQAFANLERMAEAAQQQGIVPVYLTPIPVDEEKASRMWMAGIGIDYRTVNRQIDELSDRILASGRLAADTRSAFRDFIAAQPVSGDAYRDGVHPTAEGYQHLADAVSQWIRAHADQLGLA